MGRLGDRVDDARHRRVDEVREAQRLPHGIVATEQLRGVLFGEHHAAWGVERMLGVTLEKR